LDISDRQETEFNKLRNLNQYKNYTDEQINDLAQKKAIEYHVNLPGLGIAKAEEKIAQDSLRKYLNDFVPETISDIMILRDIIFLETLNGRFQDKLNEPDVDNRDMINFTKLVHENLDKILSLKDAVGITRDKKMAEANSLADKIGMMRKQAELFRKQNQASFQTSCQYCGQLNLLTIRTNHYDSMKHPFFKDRVLGNEYIVQLYLAGKLTKQDVANIFECGKDYIDWLIGKWHLTSERKRKEFKKLQEQNATND